jgi:hypothetical protein
LRFEAKGDAANAGGETVDAQELLHHTGDKSPRPDPPGVFGFFHDLPDHRCKFACFLHVYFVIDHGDASAIQLVVETNGPEMFTP